MSKNEAFEKAKRIKGYGSDITLTKEDRHKVERTVMVDKELSVKPTVITSLGEFIGFVDKLNTSYENPVFYRGQGNANYLVGPGSMRKNPKNENLMIEAFSRRFSTEVDSCTTDMARLVLMQHFGLGTRALDISESPLTGLYFACSPMKKFCADPKTEMGNWGEIVLFQNPEEDKPENLKPIHSNTVSIFSSVAFMEHEFNLWKLGMEWKKDNNLMREEKYISLVDVLRGSVIVRVPQDNQRIKNQQGAFILVNANEISERGWTARQAKELTDYIFQHPECTFDDLVKNQRWNKTFSVDRTWDIVFKKIHPYSGENRYPIFDTDPFNLRRLYYRENKVQQVVLIPPECKKDIIKQLAKFNITEDFVYPDMDNVAHEICLNLNK